MNLVVSGLGALAAWSLKGSMATSARCKSAPRPKLAQSVPRSLPRSSLSSKPDVGEAKREDSLILDHLPRPPGRDELSAPLTARTAGVSPQTQYRFIQPRRTAARHSDNRCAERQVGMRTAPGQTVWTCPPVLSSSSARMRLSNEDGGFRSSGRRTTCRAGVSPGGRGHRPAIVSAALRTSACEAASPPGLRLPIGGRPHWPPIYSTPCMEQPHAAPG